MVIAFVEVACQTDIMVAKARGSRNTTLVKGINTHSRSAMFSKRFTHVYKKNVTKVEKKMAAAMKEKAIGGEKNGEKRLVRVKKMPRYYPTEDTKRKLRSHGKKCFKDHKRNIRASITPGTVLILLAGPHKGKRVVFLKQLDTGLLLVTGPYKFNGVPLRRMNQVYVIATKTKLDISGVTLPERLNDAYFRRQTLSKPKHGEGEIFNTQAEEYSVSDVRKEDQKAVDTQVIAAIKANESGSYMKGYLSSKFTLQTGDYPHKMVF